MSLTNPFGKAPQKKSTAKPVAKTDSTRENVKRQLMNALEKNKDNSLQGIKLTSEQIAIEIEEEVFKQNDNSAQKREYRDKIRNLEMRIKGIRNNFIREILKKGLISVSDFCNLNEKDLKDDNYFKKLEGDNQNSKDENTTIQKNNFGPPKMKNNTHRTVNPPKLKNFLPKIPTPILQETKPGENNIETNNNQTQPQKEEPINPINNNDHDHDGNLQDTNNIKEAEPTFENKNIDIETNNIKLGQDNNIDSINQNTFGETKIDSNMVDSNMIDNNKVDNNMVDNNIVDNNMVNVADVNIEPPKKNINTEKNDNKSLASSKSKINMLQDMLKDAKASTKVGKKKKKKKGKDLNKDDSTMEEPKKKEKKEVVNNIFDNKIIQEKKEEKQNEENNINNRKETIENKKDNKVNEHNPFIEEEKEIKIQKEIETKDNIIQQPEINLFQIEQETNSKKNPVLHKKKLWKELRN